MLANHGKIWRRYDPAIESAHWRRDSEGLDQHAQAARRPAADNRKMIPHARSAVTTV